VLDEGADRAAVPVANGVAGVRHAAADEAAEARAVARDRPRDPLVPVAHRPSFSQRGIHPFL
jgi:hypothetical protein